MGLGKALKKAAGQVTKEIGRAAQPQKIIGAALTVAGAATGNPVLAAEGVNLTVAASQKAPRARSDDGGIGDPFVTVQPDFAPAPAVVQSQAPSFPTMRAAVAGFTDPIVLMLLAAVAVVAAFLLLG